MRSDTWSWRDEDFWIWSQQVRFHHLTDPADTNMPKQSAIRLLFAFQFPSRISESNYHDFQGRKHNLRALRVIWQELNLSPRFQSTAAVLGSGEGGDSWMMMKFLKRVKTSLWTTHGFLTNRLLHEKSSADDDRIITEKKKTLNFNVFLWRTAKHRSNRRSSSRRVKLWLRLRSVDATFWWVIFLLKNFTHGHILPTLRSRNKQSGKLWGNFRYEEERERAWESEYYWILANDQLIYGFSRWWPFFGYIARISHPAIIPASH